MATLNLEAFGDYLSQGNVTPEGKPLKPKLNLSSLFNEFPGEVVSRVGEAFQHVKEAGKQRITNAAGTVQRTLAGEQTFQEGKLQLAGQAAGFAGDVIGEGLQTAGSLVFKGASTKEQEEEIRKAAKEKLGELAETPVGQSIVGLLKRYEDLKVEHPRAAANFDAVLGLADFASNFLGGKVALKGGQAVVRGIGEAVETTGKVAAGVGQAVSTQATRPIFEASKDIAESAFERLKRGGAKLKEGVEKRAEIAEAPEAEKALSRTGVSEDVVTRMKSATPETRSGLGKMVEKAKEAMTDIRSRARPIEVAGEALVSRVKHLAASLKATGKKLGEVKKTLKGQPVDTADLQQSILDDLEDMGLSYDNAGKLVSEVPIDDDVMEIAGDLFKFIGQNNTMDAINLDRLRQYLRKSYTKAGVPLQGRAQGLANKYRELLFNKLDELNPEYGKLARQYASQYGVVEDFTKLLGYKGDLESITEKALRAGEVAQRVLGNASARPQAAIDDLIEAAKQAGYKGNENIDDLIRFADELEGALGTTQTRGFTGQGQRAIEGAMSRAGMIGKALETVGELGRPGAKEKLDAIQQFLDEVGTKAKKTTGRPKAKGLLEDLKKPVSNETS